MVIPLRRRATTLTTFGYTVNNAEQFGFAWHIVPSKHFGSAWHFQFGKKKFCIFIRTAYQKMLTEFAMLTGAQQRVFYKRYNSPYNNHFSVSQNRRRIQWILKHKKIF